MASQLTQLQFLIIKQMKNKLILSLVIAFAVVVFADNGPPAVYQPNYVYGETPMGVYMGNPYDMYNAPLCQDH